MKFIYPCFFFLFLSCCTNIEKQNEINIYRFEEVLFNSDEKNIVENRTEWQNQIGQFSDVYYSFLAREKDYNLINSALLSFVNNVDMKEVYDSIQVKFKNLEKIELELSNAFLNFNKYYPQYSNPRIVSMFSGFNYGVIVQDSVIAVGMDFYLGEESIFYRRLNDPEYLKFQKQSKFLVPNVMEAWYDSFFTQTNKTTNFLSQLIYKGKIMFLMKKTMPDISMDRLLRYSKSDISWCEKSEASIWAFLIENDILFSSKQKDYRTYLNHAPFSKGMTQDSPSRIAYYIGYNIVKSYMQKNNDITLSELMNNIDYNSILNKSKYKP